MQDHNSTDQSRRNYITIKEAAAEIGCGRSLAQIYIARLNKELEEKGYLIARGRVPRSYFFERMGLAKEA